MERPLRATKHCRHYSYDLGLSGKGPQCAVGVDLSEPGSSCKCWSDPEASCAKREEYTDEERAVWDAWVKHGLKMISDALAVFDPVRCGSETRKPCPHCEGQLVLQRMSNGNAWLTCTTEACISQTHFSVDKAAKWPDRNCSK